MDRHIEGWELGPPVYEGQVPFDDVREDELVHIGAHHALRVVVARQQLFYCRHEQPKGVFFLHEDQLCTITAYFASQLRARKKQKPSFLPRS